MSNPIINLNQFAEGALAERVNIEMKKLLENIADPNTDANKVRKLTVVISLKADDQRDIAGASIQTKVALAPAKSIESKILLDLDSSGKVTGQELKSGLKGQTFIDTEGEIADDRGNKIVSFK
jgi:hypothetical protein